jgi:hypothetical protein
MFLIFFILDEESLHRPLIGMATGFEIIMKARQCHVILGPYQAVIDLSKQGRGRNENSRRKYQEQEYRKEKQMNAALQDICFATCKRDHAYGQC